MSLYGNSYISNECDATPPLDIDTNPHTPSQYEGISDVSEPSQGPSNPYNANYPAE